MAWCARLFLICLLVLGVAPRCFAVDARFDLVGPRINVRVTRNGVTLPIAEVPNLQPGDRLWLHPDLPATQSVKYLLVCAFLRGSTNPPPEDWFTRIETWQQDVREEGVFVTVPKGAQQVVLFLAPETGGDFSTLKSAVRGRPGVFVRASQDLNEAGFEQSRIERYLADIRRAPAGDPDALQKHSDLLARTLALKPNGDCFKQPVDTQFTCLTQTGSQTLLDDGHGETIAAALSNGPGSDLINQASYTQMAGGGLYSAYVGAVVDLVRLMSNIHTAQYQYIPAVAFPQSDAMNLRLNSPPSFHNPKSVLVIGLPAVQPSPSPPLRPADPSHVACLIEPSVTLPIEGAPLVFSTSLAHDLVLHLNVPPGAPAEPDIPLVADAYHGGLVLQREPQHHVPLHSELKAESDTQNNKDSAKTAPPPKPQPEPTRLTGTIQGEWGFDSFVGPTVPLQQLPGSDWQIASNDSMPSGTLIAGHSAQLLITSTGSACVHTITAQPRDSANTLKIDFKPTPTNDQPNLLTLTMPLENDITPGDLNIQIQQFGQPKTDSLSARTFSEPAKIDTAEVHAADRTLLLTGERLNEIERVHVGDLVYKPQPASPDAGIATADTNTSLMLTLPADAPLPPTKVGEQLTARINLRDGRSISVPIVVSAPRPVVTLLSKNSELPQNSIITLTSSDDLPLSAPLTFTLRSVQVFPRNGRVEVETVDGTLRSVLTLAPSGGLVLEDPHTVVATVDPLRAFGPSAFGKLHVRAIFPPPSARNDISAPPTTEMANNEASSDWLPLGTLVRLPQLSALQCPVDAAAPCTLAGSSLYLIDSIATDPAFTNPSPVPDGFTGNSLVVPHPAGANTLFLKLRDDPAPVNAASLPVPASQHPTIAHVHHVSPAGTHSSPGNTSTPVPEPTPASSTEPANGTTSAPSSAPSAPPVNAPATQPPSQPKSDQP
jgi:hypothetical protein